MNRRGAPPIMLLMALAWACACGGAIVSAYATPSFRWARSPSITVVAADGDARIGAVREAVAFWNETFAQLGSTFRLGDIRYVSGAVPDHDVQLLGEEVLQHRSERTMPASLERVPGDLVIVLSSATFVSYTARGENRVIVAIKNGSSPPLTLPNVLRNVIAHELGHAIGLEHDDDPALLMCGRPAACRPDAFESATPRFFPLSERERRRLLLLYPPPSRH